MTGTQVDLLNWYAQKHGTTWNQMVQNFAIEHLDNATRLAREEAAAFLTVDDLVFRITELEEMK